MIPGLPTTVFYVAAAGCFSRSSERLERWLLNLPGVGQLVSDFRDGLGMPRRAKYMASTSIVLAVGLSSGIMIDPMAIRILVVSLGLVGVWYVWTRVPTKENQLRL